MKSMDMLYRIRESLEKWVRPKQLAGLIRFYLKCCAPILSRFFSADLNRLATIHSTDKWNYHWYTQHYMRHFHALRKKNLNIIEIGVGGYDHPEKGGNSLRMWKYYFPNSIIYAIDIYEKSRLQEKRIKIFKGSQTDEQFIRCVFDKIGFLDIVIDDGSHKNADVIATFNMLFPLLNDGGIYVVEDTQTSYWPKEGGDSDNLNNPKTIMNFFKGLTDCLNYSEFIKPGYHPTYFDKNIVAVHFYHNLIFILKGQNNEGSKTLNGDTG